MPNSPVDPASLEGDDLVQWYRRSPWQIDQERQALRRKQYNNFFGIQDDASESNDPAGSMTSQYGDNDGQLPDTNPTVHPLSPSQIPFPGGVSDGRTSVFGGSIPNNLYDDGLAGPDDGGAFSLVGNPAHPRLRREWSQKWGLPWPRDPVTGQNYDVAHIIAKADGGKDHVDNIRPMPRADHLAEHMANGDPRRWGLRPGIARAFGGTVARSLGPLSIFSDILGMVSGRIRHDNFDNFSSDMMGVPSQEDRQKALEDQQRSINPNWKRGDPIVFQL